MKNRKGTLLYSPSDLANHIHCRHLTQLNVREALGLIDAPPYYADAGLDLLKEKGLAFEAQYLNNLKAQGLSVVEINREDWDAEEKTLQAMQAGVDVVFQARLQSENWSGWSDFLIKTYTHSELGNWSYEVWDTKLATDTKAATILQIGLYTQRVAEIQGVEPEFMGVIKPDGEDKFRYHDYAAYIRLVKSSLEKSLTSGEETYPDPVAHCDICRWWPVCNKRRRDDDHLTFVAGMGTGQRLELDKNGIETLAQLAEAGNPVPLVPQKGHIHTFNKLQEQAKIQFDSRNQGYKPLTKLLPLEEGRGLFLLPEPSEHDIFLDLEGARMVEPDGLEYLTGYYYQGNYTALWAENEQEELKNFQTFMSWAHQLRQQYPQLHIYHYNHYEPTAFKRMMGKYAECENEVDDFLRSQTFVDLYTVLRQTLIASVERYSLKDLEVFFGYERQMDLREVSLPKSNFELRLEAGDLEGATEEEKQIIEEYNKDDCRALPALQKWLEDFRTQLIQGGEEIPRPEPVPGEASEHITAHQERIQPLFDALMKEVPELYAERNAEQQANYILAHFLDWYRREKKSMWWDVFRMMSLEKDDLLEERKAISYLSFTGKSTFEKKSRIDEYSFPFQEVDFDEGSLKNRDNKGIGSLVSVDRDNGLLLIKKGPKFIQMTHPQEIFYYDDFKTGSKEESIIRIAEWYVHQKTKAEEPRLGLSDKLLRRQAPKFPKRQNGQGTLEFALATLLNMDSDYLAIQGPPGAGKSYTGSHLILGLIKAGKRIGITAMSHKVITNLLAKTWELAQKQRLNIRVIQKGGPDPDAVGWMVTGGYGEIDYKTENYDILAGTSFMWAREELTSTVDYMFVDEAGQLALIDTLALSQAAKNLVLLGDPNQLQQPQQGVHPAGTEVSALEHILNGEQTIQPDQGIFLETTWRMHPKINALVSELFYQNRLQAEAHLANQKLTGNPNFKEGIQVIEVPHEGNTSSSPEEVSRVKELLAELCNGKLKYTDGQGKERIITRSDIKIISPYNAQVNLLQTELPDMEIGTVDKFQGQEAPIILYSVASSSPADAPRGMDFLYSPNRLNVAISRAKVFFIMVASPAIFEPDCRSPREMKLANAFCRVREGNHVAKKLTK